jgi:glucosamine kinase
MQAAMGVDGGGTGCRVRLVAPDGRVLAEATGGPANIATDPDGAAARILAAMQTAADAGGVALRDVRAVLGLAGANAPGMAERLAARLPVASARIVSDAQTGAVGALGGAEGIVAAMGTGSVFARVQGGRFDQVGGWGPALGDEGGGAALGRRLLRECLRAATGLRAETQLLRATLAQHGGADGIVGLGVRASPADLAALAPALFADPDPAADAILDAEAAEFTPFLTLLGAGADLPVTFIGGLGPLWAARLNGRWPIRAAQGSALDGAVRLALAGPVSQP